MAGAERVLTRARAGCVAALRLAIVQPSSPLNRHHTGTEHPGSPLERTGRAARGRRAKRSPSSGSSARPTSTTSRASGGGSESNALPPPNVSARAGLALALQPHLPHEVALAEWHALHAQDVVCGRGVEVEVGQRERQEKSIGRERHLEGAELE